MKHPNTTHGHSANYSRSPEYNSWQGIKKRCFNPNEVGYPSYGGRGITMCKEWRENFMEFFEHIGPRPTPYHSIDRIDNDGDYEPGNVRWATMLEQARNKHNNRVLTLDGESHCVCEWASIRGMSESRIRGRLSKGWTLRDALMTPIRPHKPYKARA